jgi:hypothetical protein
MPYRLPHRTQVGALTGWELAYSNPREAGSLLLTGKGGFSPASPALPEAAKVAPARPLEACQCLTSEAKFRQPGCMEIDFSFALVTPSSTRLLAQRGRVKITKVPINILLVEATPFMISEQGEYKVEVGLGDSVSTIYKFNVKFGGDERSSPLRGP